jgi:hypothetical protein
LQNENLDSKSNQESIQSFKLISPGPIISAKDIKTNQIYHQTKQNQEKKTREQLFSNRTNANTSKFEEKNPITSENVDIDKLIIQEQSNQERLANEMLLSVRSIKQNALIANKIIVKDNIVKTV